jgi:GT2 family glycosyltransferase
MKSAIAIITYRRLHALLTMFSGIAQHCPHYSLGVFEDCGQRDETADFLQVGRKPVPNKTLWATEYVPVASQPSNMPNAQMFLGDHNLGVAGNSNRALKWFMDGDWDHLCLCNDDLHVKGDFVQYYAKAHEDLDVGMFCFCDFTGDTYKWTTTPWRGYKVKFLPRFTGIMMSVTRKLVEKLGYFDSVFGQFGEEHCDYTIRARLAGGISLQGQPMNCLDVEHNLLAHQEVETSVVGAARQQADREASVIMRECSKSYGYRHYYRPFRLKQPVMAGGYRGGGIPAQQLLDNGYALVSDLS